MRLRTSTFQTHTLTTEMKKKQLINELRELFIHVLESENEKSDAFSDSEHASGLTNAQYRTCLTVADYLHRRVYAPDHSVGYSGVLGNVIRAVRAALGHFDFATEVSVRILEHTKHYTVHHTHDDVINNVYGLRK